MPLRTLMTALKPKPKASPGRITGPIRGLKVLGLGQSWHSDNGRVSLRLDSRGELAVLLDGKVAWRFDRKPVSRLIVQADGRMTIWREHDCLLEVAVANRPNTELRLQDDGNIVFYDNNVPLWWSGTHL